jgi:hypothetical protein
MIEHTPWVGPDYPSLGIDGQRIAIVGYSHYRSEDEPDSDDFTEIVVRKVIDGRLKGDSFFPKIPGYFGFDERVLFWNRVIFFNFLPDCVGYIDDKYRYGTQDQIERGQARFLRIIRDQTKRPNKVLVFSTKAWGSLPPTTEEESGKPLEKVGKEIPSNFEWGTYAAGDEIVMAFGLRHPQGARTALMQAAVKQILSIPRVGTGSA